MTALRAEGFGGQIESDGVTVKISRRGLRAKGQPEGEFPLGDVVKIDFKPGTALTNGHIRFVIAAREVKSLLKDPTLVFFSKKETEQFEALRSGLNGILSARGELTAERITELEAEESARRDVEDDEKRQRQLETAAKWERRAAIAVYDKHLVKKGTYSTIGSFGLGVKRPIAGARAEFESGSDRTRPTLVRIGAGALLAGPVGAIAGGMFKKDRTKAYVTIAFEDGATVIIDGPAKDEKKMREFTAQVNRIAELEVKWAAEDNPDAPIETAEVDDEVEERLMKLKRLHEAGVLDDEQYAEKSAPLIAQL